MSILVSELRIGNWIYDDNITLSKVIGFKPFDWSVRCDEEEGCEILLDLYRTPYGVREGMLCESAKCEAIPLTPEILEKCGFVMHKDRSLWKLNNFYLHFYTLSYNEYCFKYNNFMSASIFHLHQLQNLYFALTGEELNYTP